MQGATRIPGTMSTRGQGPAATRVLCSDAGCRAVVMEIDDGRRLVGPGEPCVAGVGSDVERVERACPSCGKAHTLRLVRDAQQVWR